jgi:hypothetical protein
VRIVASVVISNNLSFKKKTETLVIAH